MVMREISGSSRWLTASDSMLKLRARIRLATRFRTPGRLLTIATSTWRRWAPATGTVRGVGPRRRVLVPEHREDAAHGPLGVPHDGDLRGHVLADLLGVDVDVDDPRVR